MKLQVVGGGKMGAALVGGLLAAEWAEPSDIVVVEALESRRDELAAAFDGVVISAALERADGVLLAVKPDAVADACAAIGAAGAPKRLLSVAAGVTLSAIEAALGSPDTAVVRAMPNTPALVGQGAAAIAPGTSADATDLAWAESILRSVGSVVTVTEDKLDAVTGLSGSGPAYVFLVAEAMVEGGVLNGLPRDIASDLALQTILGSATLAVSSERDPAGLRADVTSPGGTTAAGLRALEDGGVHAAFLDAISRATERSRVLGEQ